MRALELGLQILPALSDTDVFFMFQDYNGNFNVGRFGHEMIFLKSSKKPGLTFRLYLPNPHEPKTFGIGFRKEWWSKAMISNHLSSNTGGIDLSLMNKTLKNKGDHRIKFHWDAAMLSKYQDIDGIFPEIIRFRPLIDFHAFIGA